MPLVKQANAEPIPGYRLMEPLGKGGFGEVWKCEAPGGLLKAIKFIYGSMNALEESYRAEQELSALERVKAIRHPFVLSIERVEIVEGELAIVMELADKSLHDLLMERQAENFAGLERNELLDYMADAAEALDLMNEQHNLQHLDIKPRNLFVVSNHVKIADFGLVKDLEGLSSTNMAMGGLMGAVTPLYASPETFQGIISKRSDQYSLAIVYQELLTGSLPFNGRNPRQLAMQHTRQEPDLRPLPEPDRPIVGKALSKDPHHRFESCVDFVKALTAGKIQPVTSRKLASGSTGIRRAFGVGDSYPELQVSPQAAKERHEASDSDISPRPLSPEEIARMSLTVVQPTTGALRPTLIVGLGRLGRQSVQALRCRVIDRFGVLNKLPIIRFLCIDTDQQDLQKAAYGPPEQALTASEAFLLPLQNIMHYRRNRQALDQLTQWLPLEKLYAVPRSLATNGVRAIGRLAFSENYLRLAARLKRELQTITEPAALDKAVRETNLPLRADSPQIYVITGASGGTGSGMVVDLGFTARRIIQELGHPTADVTAFLLCGAPDDPATPPAEQANLYATLMELNHFNEAHVEWSAQYGFGGPSFQDKGTPFDAVYLVRTAHRSPQGLSELASRMATYVFHDLTSPLGHRLEQSRHRQHTARETPFRSFGTYAVWYPRGLLLRVAARFAAQRLLEAWQTANTNPAWLQNVHEFADRLVTDGHWRPESIRMRIEQEASSLPEGSPTQVINAFLARLETQATESSIARDDPTEWCRKAFEDISQMVSSGVGAIEATSELAKSWLHRTFDQNARKVVDQYVQSFLTTPVQQMFDQPGYRLAAVEGVYLRWLQRVEERLEEQKPLMAEQQKITVARWQGVEQSLAECLNPGQFFLFAGKRMQKLLKSFVEKLATYARQRLGEEGVRTVSYFYTALRGRLNDLLRDLNFCRQRMKHLQDTLLNTPTEEQQELPGTDLIPSTEDTHASSAMSSSAMLRDAAMAMASRIVLPDGAKDLEEAATHFLNQVWHEQWYNLDQSVQKGVITTLGGLHRLCMTSSDLTRMLGTPMLEATAEYLGHLLQTTDVCEVELSSAQALGVDLAAQLKAYYHLATPSFQSKKADRERGFVLIPTSETGKQVGEMAQSTIPKIQALVIGGATDMLICREQSEVGLPEIQSMVNPCKHAYENGASAPQSTPHARADILDWVPLDP
jgi:serine/threonine protein kinase